MVRFRKKARLSDYAALRLQGRFAIDPVSDCRRRKAENLATEDRRHRGNASIRH